jgi:hypothetical protein
MGYASGHYDREMAIGIAVARAAAMTRRWQWRYGRPRRRCTEGQDDDPHSAFAH